MSKAVAVKKEGGTALSVDVTGFEDFAGVGTENIRADDQTIPRLSILEGLSPELNKRDGAYVEGAAAGMIYDKITGTVVDGDEGIVVVPCYFRTYLAEWRPKALGGGFVGEYPIDDPIRKSAVRNDKNQDVLPNGNELVDTAEFYVLWLTEEGPQQRLITMTKTRLKKARKWNTLIMAQTGRTADGRMFRLPMMAVKYRLRTVGESKDSAHWNVWEPSKIGTVDRTNPDEEFAFQMGLAFAKAVGAGEVKGAREEQSIPSPDRDDDIPF